MCTQVCNDHVPVNCSKTLLVELTMKQAPGKSLIAYAIIDEQSNTTLVDDRVVDYFDLPFPSQDFTMRFASQECELVTAGKVVSGLQVRGIHQQEVVSVPEALSCSTISDTRKEVVTPHMVKSHPVIRQFAKHFPEYDESACVLLLLGRNCARAMATECLTTIEPYVHRGPLGYSVVGSMCVDSFSLEETRVLRTHVSPHAPVNVTLNFTKPRPDLLFDTFSTQPDDEQLALSSEDKVFIDEVTRGLRITEKGNIEIPMSVRQKSLPNNHSGAWGRTVSTLKTLLTQPAKLKACTESMRKSIQAGFVEQIPDHLVKPPPDVLVWHLPIFCVTQETRGKYRLVFDAKAKYHGICLNDVLRPGPNLLSLLRYVLLRFREKPVGFGADIKSMFNNFMVPESQRNMLRFFWFKDNIPGNEIVPYWSLSHVFGCTSSPSVASFGLKYCAAQLPLESSTTRAYIDSSFYVDDGFFSTDEVHEAIDVLQETKDVLGRHNMELHKIVSSSPEVVKKFSGSEEPGKTQPLLTSDGGDSGTSALGVYWDTQSDQLMIIPSIPNRPFTKRGILSMINSLFDPLGLVSSVILQGRLIQRQILTNSPELDKYDWDDELPQQYFECWSNWLRSLSSLSKIRVRRAFYPMGFKPVRQELHTFCDASLKGVGYISYMRSIDGSGKIEVALISASSKLCPKAATSIPRLELCAAVEGSQATYAILSELHVKPDSVHLHTDSMIVLGCVGNETRHFPLYIERRASTIRKLFPISHWHYVSTELNPADKASRPQTPVSLMESNWFSGPEFLYDIEYKPESIPMDLLSDRLPEELAEVTVMLSSQSNTKTALSTLFERVGSWSKLLRNARPILMMFSKLDVARQRLGISLAPRSHVISQADCVRLLVFYAQKECFSAVIQLLSQAKPLPDKHKLADLSPQLDRCGLLRVGGRLARAQIEFSVRHPYLIPRFHPLSSAIISHFHSEIKHQGIHLSHGAIIQGGYFLEKGRTLIRQFIANCVTCRKLRADTCIQMMADLPLQRLEDVGAFVHIGLDVFGHWNVHDGKATRRTSATKKIWAVLFVCMPSRAIHLEPLYGMDTSSFRNALSRFFAIRGSVSTIRSDNAGNFLAVKKQLENLQVKQIKYELAQHNIEWDLNPPQASHQNGSIERKIQSVRRVLDTTIQLTNTNCLSRDEFTTFLAEAACIVNKTPLWAVSSSADDPTPISPHMLLTLRPPNEGEIVDTFSEQDALAYGQLRYRRVQHYSEMFWQRWRKEYLHTLQLRHKWKTVTPCVSVDDIVLIRDKNLPRNLWPMGRVTSTDPSRDGLVRKVSLCIAPLPGKSQNRTIIRGITDLVLLIPSRSHGCSNPSS